MAKGAGAKWSSGPEPRCFASCTGHERTVSSDQKQVWEQGGEWLVWALLA
jgi:hypothetical protein